MRAEREPDLALFTERVRAFLGREPVVHTVICGVLALAERDPRQFESSSWFTVSGPAGGRLRPAAELPEYRELFAGWVRAFALEIDGEEPPEPAAFVQRLLNRGSLWVWCDPEPVSFASTTVPAYATTRVGLVYTPKELRGRGYASACVAAMSQNALDDGLAPVLFTDLANPTSNRIYQQIGYRPVADFCEYTFG